MINVKNYSVPNGSIVKSIKCGTEAARTVICNDEVIFRRLDSERTHSILSATYDGEDYNVISMRIVNYSGAGVGKGRMIHLYRLTHSAVFNNWSGTDDCTINFIVYVNDEQIDTNKRAICFKILHSCSGFTEKWSGKVLSGIYNSTDGFSTIKTEMEIAETEISENAEGTVELGIGVDGDMFGHLYYSTSAGGTKNKNTAWAKPVTLSNVYASRQDGSCGLCCEVYIKFSADAGASDKATLKLTGYSG